MAGSNPDPSSSTNDLTSRLRLAHPHPDAQRRVVRVATGCGVSDGTRNTTCRASVHATPITTMAIPLPASLSLSHLGMPISRMSLGASPESAESGSRAVLRAFSSPPAGSGWRRPYASGPALSMRLVQYVDSSRRRPRSRPRLVGQASGLPRGTPLEMPPYVLPNAPLDEQPTRGIPTRAGMPRVGLSRVRPSSRRRSTPRTACCG